MGFVLSPLPCSCLRLTNPNVVMRVFLLGCACVGIYGVHKTQNSTRGHTRWHQKTIVQSAWSRCSLDVSDFVLFVLSGAVVGVRALLAVRARVVLVDAVRMDMPRPKSLRDKRIDSGLSDLVLGPCSGSMVHRIGCTRWESVRPPALQTRADQPLQGDVKVSVLFQLLIQVTEEGNIECLYHGWQFEGAKGTCVKIPQVLGLLVWQFPGACWS